MLDRVIYLLEQLDHEPRAFICVPPHEVLEPEDIEISQIHLLISSLAAEGADIPVYRHRSVSSLVLQTVRRTRRRAFTHQRQCATAVAATDDTRRKERAVISHHAST